MAEWALWFILAAVLIILEMSSGTFYLLMVALGAFAGGLAALGGLGIAVQLGIAAVTGIVTTYELRRRRLRNGTAPIAGRDPNVNLDVGQTLHVETWNDDGRTARAAYRGAQWDIELEPGAAARPGVYEIREIRGSRLIVTNATDSR